MGGVNMKMIQQMQRRLESIQTELAETIVEGSAGGGVVRAQVTGAREFRGISIDPSAVDPDDVEVLEDLITVAIRSEEHTSELQSRQYLVCRLLLEKKKNYIYSL